VGKTDERMNETREPDRRMEMNVFEPQQFGRGQRELRMVEQCVFRAPQTKRSNAECRAECRAEQSVEQSRGQGRGELGRDDKKTTK
jgi:hypothetical protein